MKQLILLSLLLFPLAANAQLTCSTLDGARVYSGEQQPRYLGFFGSEYATESIMNQFGAYGSEYRTNSVRNAYGRYGSAYSSYSANNSLATNPPGIYDNNELIGYLTNNTSVLGGVSLTEIEASCTFFSSSPKASPSGDVPAELTGLTLEPGNQMGEVQLNWNATPGATRYDVYVAPTQEGERKFISSTSETALLIAGAAPETTYYFFVFPANASGSNTGMWIAGQGREPYEQSSEQNWPALFTGAFPDGRLGLDLNNIGHLNENDGMIYTCVAIFNDDEPASIDGLHRLGLGLRIESMDQGIISVAKSREFNKAGNMALDGQTPSCSGRFDTSTNRYTDIIQIGNQVFDASFDLTDGVRLQLRLRSAVEL